MPSHQAHEYFCSMAQIGRYDIDSTQQSTQAIVKSALGVGGLSGRSGSSYICPQPVPLLRDYLLEDFIAQIVANLVVFLA